MEFGDVDLFNQGPTIMARSAAVTEVVKRIKDEVARLVK